MPRNKNSISGQFTTVNKIELVNSGKEYFDLLLSLINNARESIHAQYYIFKDDATGIMIAEALKAAAKRNVQVHLLVDGYASQSLSRSFVHQLKTSGIHFRYFEPLFRSRHFYFGRRMHQKVFVADTRYSLVGGINVADRYNDINGENAWLDFSLYAEGEISKELCILCWKTWNEYPRNMGITPCEQHVIKFSIPEESKAEVRMSRNDWVRRKNEISKTYIDMLLYARSHVTILCSYFLPGRHIRKQIRNAVKRGVVIRVIAAGRSDVMLAKNAERWLYDWLLRNGIEMYEYQENILHGKLAVCDDDFTTIGSYNINDISAYASIELNLDVRNYAFTQMTTKKPDNIINKKCKRITFESHIKSKNFLKQFIRWLSYQFIRMVFFLFTFYFKHDH